MKRSQVLPDLGYDASSALAEPEASRRFLTADIRLATNEGARTSECIDRLFIVLA